MMEPDFGAPEFGAVCIPNISYKERQRRLTFGAVQLALGVALLIGLMVMGADRWWRLGLWLFFSGAAIGFFQWRDKT